MCMKNDFYHCLFGYVISCYCASQMTLVFPGDALTSSRIVLCKLRKELNRVPFVTTCQNANEH